MANEHHNEPRDIGYSPDNEIHYSGKNSWVNIDSSTIFAGKRQKDLFIFAMALGYHKRNLRSNATKTDKMKSNIPVSAVPEDQKWAVLSTGILDANDLICLKDERDIYKKAELYAEEGIRILESHMDKWSVNYPKFLEKELKEILKE